AQTKQPPTTQEGKHTTRVTRNRSKWIGAGRLAVVCIKIPPQSSQGVKMTGHTLRVHHTRVSNHVLIRHHRNQRLETPLPSLIFLYAETKPAQNPQQKRVIILCPPPPLAHKKKFHFYEER
ncbi:unnamed protein product, partial [Ectocarpus sp. 13 AM-2016]